MASTNEPLQVQAGNDPADASQNDPKTCLDQRVTPETGTPTPTPTNTADVSVTPVSVNEKHQPEVLSNNVKEIKANGVDSSVHAESNAKPISEVFHPLQQCPDEEAELFEFVDAPVSNTSPKKSKRVYFTEDKIVSGYMDPPSPWNEASACSTEELMQAYKAACEKHGVKPLPRLLNQLLVINDFCDRNETLTLKGERLDYKHCETMEEILRRVQFQTIDLEGTHLEEEGAVALFDMIEYYESCCRLNISNNRTIGVRGWQACARLMKKTPCLEKLEARNCTISEQVMPFVCRSLRLGSPITTLHLENSIMSGRPLIILVTALKMNDILQELYLADNKLMPSDGIQLGNLLRYNFRLQLLDVRNNHLMDVGVNHICDGLWEQNLDQGLATLVMWNNQVTYQSMNSLRRALMNTKNLETLNLGHNNITNEGIHRLKEGLLHNKSLLRIGLQAAKISCEGAVALAEFIAESPRLLRIDLRENDIKTGGLMALSLSLKVSESVTRIDLDKETKRETSMKDYQEQQRRLLNDITNYMQRNRDLARLREEQKEREHEQELLAEVQRQLEQSLALEQQTEETSTSTNPFTDADTDNDQDIFTADTPNKEEDVQEDKVDPQDVTLEESPRPHTQRPDHLDLNFTTPSQTLDSPAFVIEGALPFFEPSEAMTSEVSDTDVTKSQPQGPIYFPPSPMVSTNGRPTLAPILGATLSVMSPSSVKTGASFLGEGAARGDSSRGRQQVVLRKSPSSSPTMRRKFVISRVQEPDKPQPDSDSGVSDLSSRGSSDTTSVSSENSETMSSLSQEPHTADRVTDDNTSSTVNSLPETETQSASSDNDTVEKILSDNSSSSNNTSVPQTNGHLASDNPDSTDDNSLPSEGTTSVENFSCTPDVNNQSCDTSTCHRDVHSHSSLETQSDVERDSKMVADISTLNGVHQDIANSAAHLKDQADSSGQDSADQVPDTEGNTASLSSPDDFEKELAAMLSDSTAS